MAIALVALVLWTGSGDDLPMPAGGAVPDLLKGEAQPQRLTVDGDSGDQRGERSSAESGVTVVNAVTRDALPGARVYDLASGQGVGASAADGRVGRAILEQPQGVSIELEGYLPRRIRQNDVRAIGGELVLHPKCTVRVWVRDANGDPLSGVALTYSLEVADMTTAERVSLAGYRHFGTTNAQGYCERTSLPRGQRVRLRSPAATESFTIGVTSFEELTLVVDAVSLSGRLIDHTGSTETGALVRWHDLATERGVSLRTDDRGVFHFASLSTGWGELVFPNLAPILRRKLHLGPGHTDLGDVLIAESAEWIGQLEARAANPGRRYDVDLWQAGARSHTQSVPTDSARITVRGALGPGMLELSCGGAVLWRQAITLPGSGVVQLPVGREPVLVVQGDVDELSYAVFVPSPSAERRAFLPEVLAREKRLVPNSRGEVSVHAANWPAVTSLVVRAGNSYGYVKDIRLEREKTYVPIPLAEHTLRATVGTSDTTDWQLSCRGLLGRAETEFDEDGNAATLVAAGPVLVSVRDDEYRSLWNTLVLVTEPEVVLEVDLTSGGIAGQVVDAEGRGRSGREVAITGLDTNSYWQASTDADGAFAAHVVPRGNYLVACAGTYRYVSKENEEARITLVVADDQARIPLGDLGGVLGCTFVEQGGQIRTCDVLDDAILVPAEHRGGVLILSLVEDGEKRLVAACLAASPQGGGAGGTLTMSGGDARVFLRPGDGPGGPLGAPPQVELLSACGVSLGFRPIAWPVFSAASDAGSAWIVGGLTSDSRLSVTHAGKRYDDISLDGRSEFVVRLGE